MSALHEALALAARTRLELEAKGYPAGAIGAAIERALGTAERQTEVLSEGIREQAFHDILAHELRQCERWLTGNLDFIRRQGASPDDNPTGEGGES